MPFNTTATAYSPYPPSLCCLGLGSLGNSKSFTAKSSLSSASATSSVFNPRPPFFPSSGPPGVTPSSLSLPFVLLAYPIRPPFLLLGIRIPSLAPFPPSSTPSALTCAATPLSPSLSPLPLKTGRNPTLFYSISSSMPALLPLFFPQKGQTSGSPL